MRVNSAPLVFLVAALGLTNAGAMGMSHGTNSKCYLVGGEKLPRSLNSRGDAICAEVRRAIAATAPHASFTAKVRVLSKSRLAATLVVDGHALPEQHFAIMDSELDDGAIQRFAASLASAIAEAAKARN
jgi:hypothetical protein